MIRDIFFKGPTNFMIVCGLVLMMTFLPERLKKPLKKQGRAIAAGLITVVAVSLIDFYFIDFDTAQTSLEGPLCFAAEVFFGAALLKLSKKEAFYCTVWSYILTELAVQPAVLFADMLSAGRNDRAAVIINSLVYVVMIAVLTVFVRYFLVPQLQTDGRYHVGRQKLLMTSGMIVIYFVISDFQFIFWMLGEEPNEKSVIITVFRAVSGIACLFFLYLQSDVEKRQLAEKERDMIRQLWHRQQQQYKISQESIDAINRKCHDLKYQMEALRKLKDSALLDEQLKEMENSVMIYDSVVKTGNSVLDTVLSEKSLFCEKHQINMTCMADGKSLDFVGSVDLYTILGNALDNAIECVMKLKEIEKRIIQVSVYCEKKLLMIRIRNYCGEKPVFSGDLPVTSKSDRGYHGFGLKSIRYTAEKYGGGMTCRASENEFTLQILLPMPEDKI